MSGVPVQTCLLSLLLRQFLILSVTSGRATPTFHFGVFMEDPGVLNGLKVCHVEKQGINRLTFVHSKNSSTML